MYFKDVILFILLPVTTISAPEKRDRTLKEWEVIMDDIGTFSTNRLKISHSPVEIPWSSDTKDSLHSHSEPYLQNIQPERTQTSGLLKGCPKNSNEYSRGSTGWSWWVEILRHSLQITIGEPKNLSNKRGSVPDENVSVDEVTWVESHGHVTGESHRWDTNGQRNWGWGNARGRCRGERRRGERERAMWRGRRRRKWWREW
jgi:hypothetical protein